MRRLSAALGLAALAVGCAADPEPAASPAPQPAAQAEEAPVEAIDIALLEYVIGMPTTIEAGPQVFRLSNQGFELHNLKFFNAAGELVWETSGELAQGEDLIVEFELAPGAYSVVCDVAGHDARGMVKDIEVVESSDN